MNPKKTFACLLSALSVLLALAACHEPDAPEMPPEPPAAIESSIPSEPEIPPEAKTSPAPPADESKAAESSASAAEEQLDLEEDGFPDSTNVLLTMEKNSIFLDYIAAGPVSGVIKNTSDYPIIPTLSFAVERYDGQQWLRLQFQDPGEPPGLILGGVPFKLGELVREPSTIEPGSSLDVTYQTESFNDPMWFEGLFRYAQEVYVPATGETFTIYGKIFGSAEPDPNAPPAPWTAPCPLAAIAAVKNKTSKYNRRGFPPQNPRQLYFLYRQVIPLQ